MKIENSDDVMTIPNPTPVECPYEGESTSSGKLCHLFCELQSYNGHYCCPQEYIGDPEEHLLCQLWTQLEQLKEDLNDKNGTDLTSSNPLLPAECIYEDKSSSSEKLCQLFCEIQTFNGRYCCPQEYIGDPEEHLLCQLWTQLEDLNESNRTDLTSNIPLLPSECIYEDNPSSSDKLCNLFCEIQTFSDRYCCPQEYIDQPEGNLLCQLWSELEELKEANGTELTTDFPLVPVDCPYENNSSSSKTCSLWCEIQTHQGSSCIHCPEKYTRDPERILICDLWSELEMIKFDIISAGSITTLTPTLNVTCVYSDHLMSSDLICEVWCMIQATKGFYEQLKLISLVITTLLIKSMLGSFPFSTHTT